MPGRCRRAASIPGETPVRRGAARALRGDQRPLRLAARRGAGLAVLRDPDAARRACLEGTLRRPAAEMVRLPLHRRGERDRRRAAGRGQAQAGVRRVALGEAGARAGADRSLQARRLRAGGGAVFTLAVPKRRGLNTARARRSVGDDLHRLARRQRIARLQAVQQLEELELALRPLHLAARSATVSPLPHGHDVDAQRLQVRELGRRHAVERAERLLQRLIDRRRHCCGRQRSAGTCCCRPEPRRCGRPSRWRPPARSRRAGR